MKLLLVIQTSCTCFAIFTSVSGTALAQITGTVTPDPAAAERSVKQDMPPPGGCMPIGITASGDVVFPLQCKDFIEQQKALKSRPAAAEETPASPRSEDAMPENAKPAAKSVETGPSPKRVGQEPRDRPKSLPNCTKYQSYDPV